MIPFKTEKDKPFNDWPEVGEILVDKTDPARHLIVNEVRKIDSLGRNVIGTLGDGNPYSCSAQTLVVVWARERQTVVQ